MENYTKARTEEQLSVCPFSNLPPDTPEIRVKDGSKIRNLLRYALSRMVVDPEPGQDEVRPKSVESVAEGRGPPVSRQMVFMATGKGVSKAITCAEIVKRRLKGLHQLTRLLYSTEVEVWAPMEPAAGLDSLTVSRNVPTIWILLSRDLLDCSQPGYQPPGRYDTLWVQAAKVEEGGGSGHKRKKGGGGRGRGPTRQTGRPRDANKGQGGFIGVQT